MGTHAVATQFGVKTSDTLAKFYDTLRDPNAQILDVEWVSLLKPRHDYERIVGDVRRDILAFDNGELVKVLGSDSFHELHSWNCDCDDCSK